MIDFATLDLSLAIAHHILVFSFTAILAAEVALIRRAMEPADIGRVARIDIYYGLIAGVILIVGFCRATMAAKGWAYYSMNLFFWAKMATFATVGLLSIPPTLAYLRWRRKVAGDPDFAPPQAEIGRVQRYLRLELLGLGVVVSCAAAMARGYGLITH